MSIISPETQYPTSSPIIDKIRQRWTQIDSMAGVGIDPDVDKIPAEIWDEVGGYSNLADGIELFNQKVIDATAEYVVDFKVNSNFFQGELGRRALAGTFKYLKEQHPDVVRVCDGKFGDVGHTADKIAADLLPALVGVAQTDTHEWPRPLIERSGAASRGSSGYPCSLILASRVCDAVSLCWWDRVVPRSTTTR